MRTPDQRFEVLAGSLPWRSSRPDLAPVEELAARAGIVLPARTAVVVGTNGKTSTATFLARLLHAAGLSVGLTISPHLRRWSERVLVDGSEVDDEWFVDEVERLAALGEGLDLRFFDFLTLAAVTWFRERGVDVAVFEAGIGGRLDTTQVLRPQLVVLTGIGLDHTEMLGPDEMSILREKLGVAPPGALVLSAPLGEPLDAEAQRLAASGGYRVEVPTRGEGTFLERNECLARAAAAQVTQQSALKIEGAVTGRMQRSVVDGVEVVLDAGHNAQAWRMLAGELPARFVAVVSVSSDKPAGDLRIALAGAEEVVTTTAWRRRSRPAAELAAGGGGSAVDDPRAATR
jgi:dihydrofolate synthase/folylpolyglutamate synthase